MKKKTESSLLLFALQEFFLFLFQFFKSVFRKFQIFHNKNSIRIWSLLTWTDWITLCSAVWVNGPLSSKTLCSKERKECSCSLLSMELLHCHRSGITAFTPYFSSLTTSLIEQFICTKLSFQFQKHNFDCFLVIKVFPASSKYFRYGRSLQQTIQKIL
jgi:hypothetical protein